MGMAVSVRFSRSALAVLDEQMCGVPDLMDGDVSVGPRDFEARGLVFGR